MSKRLYIDMEICNKCPKCVVKCAYPYHPDNNGITNLREEGAFKVICRHCDNAPCVSSCPNDALNKDEQGNLVRSSFKCSGCHSCVATCPFGTIYLDVIPFRNSQCDLCVHILKGNEIPVCVSTCPYGALKFGEFEESAERNEVFSGARVLAHGLPWKKPPKEKKK